MAQSTWHNITNGLHEALYKGYSRKTKWQREKREVADIYAHADAFCSDMREKLVSHTYEMGDYRHFKLMDSKKERDISVLPFADRVVQNSIKESIEPILMRYMTDDMLGGLPKRGVLVNDGTRGVVRKMRRILSDRAMRYYLQGDISKFYDNVDNVEVMRMLETMIRDRRTLSVIRQHIFKQKKLAIGDPFSHLMANLVMSHIIRHLNSLFHSVRMVNFADDIFIAAKTKDELYAVRRAMTSVAKRYRLHYKKSLYIRPIDTPHPITFCGFRYRRDSVLMLRRTKLRYIRARHKRRSMASYNGLLSVADTRHLRNYVEHFNNKHMSSKIRRPFAGKAVKMPSLVGVPHSIVNVEEKKSRQVGSDTYMHIQALSDELGLIVYTTSSPKIMQYLKENTTPLHNMVIVHDWSGYYYDGTVYTDDEEEAMLREQFNIPKKQPS